MCSISWLKTKLRPIIRYYDLSWCLDTSSSQYTQRGVKAQQREELTHKGMWPMRREDEGWTTTHWRVESRVAMKIKRHEEMQLLGGCVEIARKIFVKLPKLPKILHFWNAGITGNRILSNMTINRKLDKYYISYMR